MTKLPKKDKFILSIFKNQIKEILKEDNPRLILFGSKARGDFGYGSDIDILIILKKVTPEKRDIISDIATEIFLKKGIDLSPHIYSEREYQELLLLQTPFMSTVKQEGVII